MTWRSIPGYEGIYAVSDTGDVMSMDYKGSGLPGIMKQSADRKGYLHVCLNKGREVRRSVHRLVMEAFVGPRPDGFHINHVNGVKTDNRVSNLTYCTPRENNVHALQTGLRTNRGEKHSRAKLTEANVQDIRALLVAGKTQTEVARMFNVHPTAISHIKRGKTWPHVQLAHSEPKKPAVGG